MSAEGVISAGEFMKAAEVGEWTKGVLGTDGPVYFVTLAMPAEPKPPRDLLTMGTRHVISAAPRVLDGDPSEITAALDALPDGSVVTWRDDDLGDPEGYDNCVAIFAMSAMGTSHWFEGGASQLRKSDYLARHCAPLRVLS